MRPVVRFVMRVGLVGWSGMRGRRLIRSGRRRRRLGVLGARCVGTALANRLNRLGTLTYRGAGNHDPMLLRRHVGEFFRALRSSLGGDPLPYVWVPEWHKTDHGLHVHFAVGRYIPRSR